MLTASLLAWLGVGLWMLSTVDTSRRVFGAELGAGMRQVSRAAGLAALLLSGVPLVSALGAALAVAGVPLVAMSALSLAVVVAPLRPRLFAASLPVAFLALAAALRAG